MKLTWKIWSFAAVAVMPGFLGLLGCATHQSVERQVKTISDARFDTIELKKLILRDDQGRVRAQLFTDSRDSVAFTMNTGRSETNLQDAVFNVWVHTNGVGVILMRGKYGRSSITMVVDPRRTPRLDLDPDTQIILRDSHYVQRAIVGMGSNNVPFLKIYDDRMEPTTLQPSMKKIDEDSK
jgi:hypothetical protein